MCELRAGAFTALAQPLHDPSTSQPAHPYSQLVPEHRELNSHLSHLALLTSLSNAWFSSINTGRRENVQDLPGGTGLGLGKAHSSLSLQRLNQRTGLINEKYCCILNVLSMCMSGASNGGDVPRRKLSSNALSASTSIISAERAPWGSLITQASTWAHISDAPVTTYLLSHPGRGYRHHVHNTGHGFILSHDLLLPSN